MMEKKRSVGVTILGSFTIFMSIAYFSVNHLNASNNTVDVICLVIFISGIGLLRLAEWARISSILLMFYVIGWNVIVTISEFSPDDPDIGSIVIFSIFLLFILAGMIFYLTRPKVKEQFKKEIPNA